MTSRQEFRSDLQARLRLLTGTVADITSVLGIGFVAEGSSDAGLLSSVVHFANAFPSRQEIAGEEALKRFEREVCQTSRLTHPNTVSIFHYSRSADGVFYNAMEYLVGANLREIVERTSPLSPARIIHTLAAACGAFDRPASTDAPRRDLLACADAGKCQPEQAAAWWSTIDWQRPAFEKASEIAATVAETVVVVQPSPGS